MDASLGEGLDLVAAHGAPAQQAEALRLAGILDVTPGDSAAAAAARQLIHSYIHDPYLERG